MSQINNTDSQLKWNWEDAHQSELAFNEIKCRLISTCLPNNKCWRNYSGIPLGIGFAALSLASQISLIVEQLIKGVGNVLGSCIPGSDFSAKTGSDLLGLAVENCLKLVIGIPIVGCLSLFVIPVMTFCSPDYTKEMLTKTITDPDPYYEQNSFNDNDVLTEFVF